MTRKNSSRNVGQTNRFTADHKQLDVWKVAMRLAAHIYEVTGKFPDHEKFGMVQHMRKSAVSVPSNIAEGAGRISKSEFVRFLGIARGSLAELETQLELARALGYLPSRPEEKLFQQVERVGKMLSGLLRKFRRETDS